MKHIALQLEFETDKFRLTGPIPEDSNAGNQFYGEDFAKRICDSLPKWHWTIWMRTGAGTFSR